MKESHRRLGEAEANSVPWPLSQCRDSRSIKDTGQYGLLMSNDVAQCCMRHIDVKRKNIFEVLGSRCDIEAYTLPQWSLQMASVMAQWVSEETLHPNAVGRATVNAPSAVLRQRAMVVGNLERWVEVQTLTWTAAVIAGSVDRDAAQAVKEAALLRPTLGGGGGGGWDDEAELRLEAKAAFQHLHLRDESWNTGMVEEEEQVQDVQVSKTAGAEIVLEEAEDRTPLGTRNMRRAGALYRDDASDILDIDHVHHAENVDAMENIQDAEGAKVTTESATTTSSTNSKWLVFTSAGDFSNHQQWLVGRRFDLWLVYYGDREDNPFIEDCEHYSTRKGGKFPNLHAVYQSHRSVLLQYDAIFVLDDDIEIDGPRINRLFELREE